MSSPTAPDPFSCQAWLLDGPINSMPGILQWTGEKFEFISFGQGTFFAKGLRNFLESYGASEAAAEAIEAEEPRHVFSVPVDEVSNFKVPFIYFGKGMKFEVQGRKSRVSFIQPQNTKLPARIVGFGASDWFNELSQVHVAAPKSDIKLWKQLLG